jgi:hypothetical protein
VGAVGAVGASGISPVGYSFSLNVRNGCASAERKKVKNHKTNNDSKTSFEK